MYAGLRVRRALRLLSLRTALKTTCARLAKASKRFRSEPEFALRAECPRLDFPPKGTSIQRQTDESTNVAAPAFGHDDPLTETADIDTGVAQSGALAGSREPPESDATGNSPTSRDLNHGSQRIMYGKV